MEYITLCTECYKNEHSVTNFTFNVTPTNDGIYNVTCPNGHKCKTQIMLHHFQILFENGLCALYDNYYIETLSSFTACYERFLEYFIKVILLSNNTNAKNFEDTWKLVSNQSERQLGAFVFLYLNEFDSKPVLLNSKSIELRNKVIHKGYFPNKEECINYGNNVLEVIRPIIHLLKDNKKYEYELYSSYHYSKAQEDKEIRAHYHPYQIFAINRPENNTEEKTVIDLLKEVEYKRKF